MHHHNPPQTEETAQLSPESGDAQSYSAFPTAAGSAAGRRGGARSVLRLAEAQLFAPAAWRLEQARAKLRRLGIDAEPEEVKIVIGGTPTN